MDKKFTVPSVTTEQMREVDRLMIEEYGITLLQMMENAGRNLARLASHRAGRTSGSGILVLAGKGNNGGQPPQVPFPPRQDRPVYCSDCFSKVKPSRPQ